MRLTQTPSALRPGTFLEILGIITKSYPAGKMIGSIVTHLKRPVRNGYDAPNFRTCQQVKWQQVAGSVQRTVGVSDGEDT